MGQPRLMYKEVTIASGASLTDAIDLGEDQYICGVVMPAAWTAANLTLQASHNGSDFADLYDQDGSEVEITVDIDMFVVLSPDSVWGFRHVKVRSGTTGTPVNQAAERTLVLVIRGL